MPLTILLPCHSLEDFPRHLEGEEAAGVLAGWSALWHPALVAEARAIPRWRRADIPPTTEPQEILVIPSAAAKLPPAGWSARVRAEGLTVVEGLSRRDEIVAECLATLPSAMRAADPELSADFLALGTVYLFSELLTRHMRYMSQIDEGHFSAQAVAAAEAARDGRVDEARAKLGGCFDLLRQARDRYYPVESYLIDLALMADTTMGRGLEREVTEPTPKNVLLSGEDVVRLAAAHPENLERLKSRVAARSIGLVGGEQTWRELPLEPLEGVLRNFADGRDAYLSHLGSTPTVYGRLRDGLSPILPQALARLGFQGALGFSLDDGQFPSGDQAKIRWEGGGQAAIDCLARVPLDAADPGAWIRFAHRLGESMDMDHVATVVIAHWAGQGHDVLDDLRRMDRYRSVLGKFVTLETYFAETESPSRGTRFPADNYRYSYLAQQQGEADPISRFVERQRTSAAQEASEAIAFLADMTRGAPSPEASGQERSLARATAALAAALPRAAGPSAQGVLVLNPRAAARRQLVELSAPAAVGGAVKAVQSSGERHWAILDVPAMGFSWFGVGGAAAGARNEPKLAEGFKLRNEFCEVTIDPKTGGIRSLHDFQLRANRLSQRLVFRDADEPALEDGLRMSAEKIEILVNGPVLAQIESRGEIVPKEGPAAARFRQRVEIVRASRVVRVEIELECLRPTGADPWNSYYAVRWAWGEGAQLRRSVGGSSRSTAAKRIEAPQFVEIEEDTRRTTILGGGLPYHRRIAEDQLDTLLVAGGEQARKFELGIGVDLACPIEEAWRLAAPVATHIETAPPPQEPTGWLFHIDSRTVVATAWESRTEGPRLTGFAARFLETSGKSQRVRLQTFRPLRAAKCVDFLGRSLGELKLEEDAAILELAPEEWVEVEGVF